MIVACSFFLWHYEKYQEMEAEYCSPAFNNSVIKGPLWLILSQVTGYLVTESDHLETVSGLLLLKKHASFVKHACMCVCLCLYVIVCLCIPVWVSDSVPEVRIILSSQFSPSILVTRDWTQVFKLALNHLPGKAFDSWCSGSVLRIFLRLNTRRAHIFNFHNALMFYIFLIWKTTLM